MEFGLWSVVPPLLAIALAILTKQVIPSLFAGVLVGTIIFHRGDIFSGFGQFAEVVVGVVTDDWNARVILFTALLGAIVGLIRKSGGFEAFGRWAETAVKTPRGAQATAWSSGMVLFFDDYFDCLTSGSVMRPVTDQHNVSREKLAYLVDTTAAAVATLIPLSTWVAFMVGLIGDEFEGAGVPDPAFGTFLSSIPFNLYAIGAVLLALYLVVSRIDYGPMRRAERRARATGEVSRAGVTEITGQDILVLEPSAQGRILDLALPIAVLVGMTVFGLLQTGGYFTEDLALIDAIGDADAATALMWATLVAVLTALAWYTARRLVSLGEGMSAIVQGIKAMLPALMILTLAWSIGEVADMLEMGEFVAGAAGEVVAGWLVPAVLFLVAAFIAFSTGTSWGTFAIMVPVAVPLALATDASMLAVIGAVFGGGVFGDHCSPISDTTILSSTGASCNHIDHVNTQLPYALTAAGVATVGFLVAGITHSALITLPVTLALLAGVAFAISRLTPEPVEEELAEAEAAAPTGEE
jgi:tetracycline resistance efflux pump